MGILTTLEPRITSFARSSILAVLSKIQYGKLTIVMKDESESRTVSFGETKSAQDVLSATVVILDSSVWTRLASNLDVGFAESYMLQQLECSNFVHLFLIYIKNWETLGSGNPLFTQRRSGHLAIRQFHSFDRKTAPSTANVEDMV